jgi:hypothetical protein
LVQGNLARQERMLSSALWSRFSLAFCRARTFAGLSCAAWRSASRRSNLRRRWQATVADHLLGQLDRPLFAVCGAAQVRGMAQATPLAVLNAPFLALLGPFQQGPKLVGTGAAGAANQGISVSLSGDRSTAIVGGRSDNNGTGAAWVYGPAAFAGTPGTPNCLSQSVAALVQQYGGLSAAASALGYSDVSALQNAIVAFCGG